MDLTKVEGVYIANNCRNAIEEYNVIENNEDNFLIDNEADEVTIANNVMCLWLEEGKYD